MTRSMRSLRPMSVWMLQTNPSARTYLATMKKGDKRANNTNNNGVKKAKQKASKKEKGNQNGNTKIN